MRKKILDNITNGKYSRDTSKGYFNTEHGWTDHLISEKIFFSHRIETYSAGSLLDHLHAHDYYELTLIAGGEEVAYISDDQIISAEPGMAILSKPMKFHMFRCEKPTLYDRFVIYFRKPTDIFPEQSIMDFVALGNDSFAAFASADQSLLGFAAAAEAALTNRDSDYASAKAYLSVCNLFLTLSDHKEVCANAVPPPVFISQIKKFVDTNFLNLRSVNDVADHFFYSREYISRSFQKYFNTPLYDYILNRKMMHCCALLQRGESVETAARKAGFHNMSSFVKVFRKRYGCNPSEYKTSQHPL